MTARLRLYREEDTPRLIEVLASVFSEYGMTFEPDGFDRDVREAHVRYAAPRGVFFAAEDSGEVLGFAGADLPRSGTAEVHRLYLDPRARGQGLGGKLCAAVEDWARERGATTMELWSDVRFFHAHLMYAKRGYRLFGQRLLGDPDRSIELGFRRSLAGDAAPVSHDANGASRSPLEEALRDPERAHAVSMLTAAILDARALVRTGRMAGARHELPHPLELFSGSGPREVSVLALETGVLAGFERSARGERSTRLHPLFCPW
ncbi:GNAT family N-acetyltransferase [bacterium]|nr:GNAT family N-acetyltransferase [bacterium]